MYYDIQRIQFGEMNLLFGETIQRNEYRIAVLKLLYDASFGKKTMSIYCERVFSC